MLNSLQNLLTSFFMADDAVQAQGAGNLQLATAVLLFDVMRSDDNISDAERAQALTSLRQLRIPLIVTDDSRIVTGRSGDRDRRIEPVGHSAL